MNTYALTLDLNARLSTVLTIMETKSCIVIRVERMHDCYLVLYKAIDQLFGFPFEF